MLMTDSLSLVFIACFLFGLLFIVVSAFMGHLGHAHDSHVIGHDAAHAVGKGLHVGHAHASSQKGVVAKTSGATDNHASLLAYVNPTTIAMFLLGFGFFGYIFKNTAAFVLPLTLILASVSGFIIAGLLLTMINRLFGNSEGATVQDVSDRTGMLGKVSITIQENSFGEVLYTSPGGMRKSVPARTIDGQRLERGQEVVVVNYQQGIAEVDTWDHFINRAVSGNDEVTKLGTLLGEVESQREKE